jgi:hypothetical protein
MFSIPLELLVSRVFPARLLIASNPSYYLAENIVHTIHIIWELWYKEFISFSQISIVLYIHIMKEYISLIN